MVESKIWKKILREQNFENLHTL